MDYGWIKLHRKIIETDLWHDVTTFRLFTYLILKASYQDGVKIKGITLKRGQWIRSYRKLAEDLSYKEGRGRKEYSIKTIKKCVDKLKCSGTVTVQETELGTLFTVVNYALYQGLEDVEKRSGNGTVLEVVTNREQEQEVKNAKEEKEYISLPFDGDVFLNIYNNHFKTIFGKDHMNISINNQEFIKEQIDQIKRSVDHEEFETKVQEHFANLPEGNNGNIIPFLYAKKRHFGIDDDFE